MGSCCSSSDTAANVASVAPPSLSTAKNTAKPSTAAYHSSRASMVDFTPLDSPRTVQPIASFNSVPRMYGTKEFPQAAVSVVGPPAAQTDRKILTSSPSQPFPTLRVEKENESRGDLGADSCIKLKPLPAAKDVTGTPAEIQIITPAQQRSGDEAAEQLTGSPATVAFPSSDVTPERAMAPMLSQSEDRARTRCPSTAQVDEVPPTPKDESGKTLPADDVRVLQRAPPPPPPMATSTEVATCKEANLHSKKRGVDEAHESYDEATHNVEQKDSVAEANEGKEKPESSLLADIIHSQQEIQQRHSTVVSTDAAKDAPVEIGLGGKDESPSAVAVETHVKEDPQSSSPLSPGIVNEVRVTAYDIDEVNALPDMPIVTTVAPEQEDGSRSSSVYKIPDHHTSSPLNKTGALHSISSDEVDECIYVIAPGQQRQEAEEIDAHGTQLSPRGCPTQELSQAEPIISSKVSLLEGSPRHQEASHGAGVSSRVCRPLHLATDILQHKERASASDISDKVAVTAAFSESGSEVDEQGVAHGLGDDSEKPIVFTATSEVELEIEAMEENNDDEGTLSMDKDCVYTMGNTDVVENLQPMRSVMSSAALEEPMEAAGEHTDSAEPHTPLAMQAAGKPAGTATEAPRRMPPPPPHKHRDGACNAQLSSRSVPPSIMSPPPA
ncbi:hypothetical protein, unknown function [Leishmania tarentolae]|uniref:Uncharacterized protein n=1 Tax=Leishmania tarentolae TaxID=5689 RepID=A0A640KRI5_LEITA|nr:hypothetical protein, unknown function [Leishmania tarentolae]